MENDGYHQKMTEKTVVHLQWSLILKVEHNQLSSFSMMTFAFENYGILLFEIKSCLSWETNEYYFKAKFFNIAKSNTKSKIAGKFKKPKITGIYWNIGKKKGVSWNIKSQIYKDRNAKLGSYGVLIKN